jgi:hypothetical protein
MFIVYAALTALASLNRETGVLLVLFYALYYRDFWRDWRVLGRIALLGAIWAGITIGLHLSYGEAEHVLGLAGTFRYNLNNLPEALFSNALIVPMWVAAILAYRHAPLTLRRLCWSVLAYLLTVIVYAAWAETRLQLTILPIVLAVILAEPAFSQKNTQTEAASQRKA